MFRFDYEQITEIMQSFHLITGVQMAIFDAEFREVATYPKENCEFCKVMKSCPKTRRKCNYADRRSMSECQKKNGLVIYKCHAGLCEAVVPLHENEQIIGYMMLGQITDSTDRTALLRGAEELADKYGFDADELKKAVGEITYKNESEIAAAAKIMEACTSYILLKELITPEHSRLLDAAKEGDGKAQYVFAQALWRGVSGAREEGVKNRGGKGWYWCNKAAENGYGYAQLMRGITYRNDAVESGDLEDHKKAVDWLEKALSHSEIIDKDSEKDGV
jgi:ligand-binding sensor protein